MIETFGTSDVGCVRELNEDCFCINVIDKEKNRGYFILADGMGGHNAGEVASQSVVTFISDKLKCLCDDNCENIPALLTEAINGANEQVYKMSQKNREQSGMGTTVVVAVVWENIVYIANVGDSRAYIADDNEIIQITTDHSIVAELLSSGTITKEEARNHPQKNIITRAVGTDLKVSADLFEYNITDGKTLFLCSDGLCTMLSDDEIFEIQKGESSLEKVVYNLIDASKNSGGLDNITVVFVRFI